MFHPSFSRPNGLSNSRFILDKNDKTNREFLIGILPQILLCCLCFFLLCLLLALKGGKKRKEKEA